MEILKEFDGQAWVIFFLAIAVFRIYLEVIKFDFARLPVTRQMGDGRSKKIHKFGFYMSVGYFMLYGPSFLLS